MLLTRLLLKKSLFANLVNLLYFCRQLSAKNMITLDQLHDVLERDEALRGYL